MGASVLSAPTHSAPSFVSRLSKAPGWATTRGTSAIMADLLAAKMRSEKSAPGPRSAAALYLDLLQYRRVAALACTCTGQKLQIGPVHALHGSRPAVAVGTLSEHCWCMVQVRGHAPKQTACRSELPDRRSCGHKLGAALYASPPSAAGSSTDELLGLVCAARAISG